MAISKQQEAVIDMIVSYKPTTWVIATKSEAKKIPEEGRAEFVKTLLHGIDIYKSKVSNAASILKRGPNLNPEVNIRAWALMHARYLARLFIKHPSLCERLCVKVANETYNPGWTGEVKRFRSIEDHKWEIEEQVENACRESEAQHSYASNPPSRMSPQMGVFQVNIGNNQPPTSILRRRNRTRQPKHVRFALAVEKNATAELEIINKMDVTSLYRTPQGKAHQLHLERELQVKAAAEDEDMYGVSDEEMNRSANTRNLDKRKRVARPYSLRITTSQEPAVITDSDFEDDIQLTPISPDSDATISDHGEGLGGKYSWHSNGMALRNHLSNIQGGTTNKAAAPTLNPETEDDAEDEDSFAVVESIDGDNEEQFSLKEMIDAMEYLADHPWICENGMVDHVWDEYKLFHEYNAEALKVAEEEIEGMEKAAVTETTASTHKEKEVDCVPTSIHRTRSTDQNASSTSTYLPSATLPVDQEEVADGNHANHVAAADKAKALSAAINSSYQNRDLRMQVAAVYDPLPDPIPVDANTISADNAPPRRSRSSDRSVPGYSAPAPRSQSSSCQEDAAQVIDYDDTITVETSPQPVPVDAKPAPSQTAPHRGRSSDRSIPFYTNTAPEIEFPSVARSRPQTRSMQHQTTGTDRPPQSISRFNDRKEDDPWFNGFDPGDFGTLGMDLDLNLNLDMDLDTDLFPYPNWDSFDNPGQRGADARRKHGHDFNARGMSGVGSSGMNGMHRTFGGMKQPFGNLHQPSGGFESMDQFKQKTLPGIFNDQLDFSDMNRSFNQPDEMDIDDQEAPQTPQIPHLTRASTRSQREYDFSAKRSAYFESEGTQLTDEENEEEDLEEESPSKRAHHRKDTSKSSTKNSTKATPKRPRKSAVKQGPKVPFAPRPASAPSTLDRRPFWETRQTKLISAVAPHGMFDAQLTIQIPQPTTPTLVRTRSKSKGKLDCDPKDPDL